MKKYIVVIFIAAGIFLAWPALAREMIDDFSTTIKVNSDSSINVIEKISYDFGAERKHGIYRDIPFKYKAGGGSYKLRISDVAVVDGRGRPLPFKVLRRGNNKRIKIGEADKYVAGVKKYVISYTVGRAINYFSDYDELYWNATGNEWPVVIKQSKARVILPERVGDDNIRAECFSGPYGSTHHCLSGRYVYGGANMVSGFVFTADRLEPGEGLTVVVGWPKGIVSRPAVLAVIGAVLADNWILVVPLVIFMFLFYLWRTRGRDPAGHRVVIARYSPPDGLTPAEVGAVIDEKADKRDLSAEIINLAVKGYIKITRLKAEGFLFKKSDYLLEKLKDADDLAGEHERILLNGLFAQKNIGATINNLKTLLLKRDGLSENSPAFRVLMKVAGLNTGIAKEEAVERSASRNFIKLSCLKNTFYASWKRARDEVYRSVIAKGYFSKNPGKVRSVYTGIGAGIIVLSWTAGSFYGAFGIASLAVSGILFIVFGYFMPARTKKGVLAKERISGLKLYLSVAEKERIKFHNSPQKDPRHFEELLPYAMVLGVEKEWAGQFAELYHGEPFWYHDSTGRGFNAPALVGSLSAFQARANSVLASRPSSAASGGSGFSGGGSGGGFGGGGGGSW